MWRSMCVRLFFFFQAEDGIRDHCVTGVQTCALPISSLRSGHTLMAELVAAGEIDLALDAHVQGVARLKEKGAPIDWKPLQPSFGQPSSVGTAARAPHPTAALLFADFVLSREGQEIINS